MNLDEKRLIFKQTKAVSSDWHVFEQRRLKIMTSAFKKIVPDNFFKTQSVNIGFNPS